jgi:hypothetical protein
MKYSQTSGREEASDSKVLCRLVYIGYVFTHLISLNLSLQGKAIYIFNIQNKVIAKRVNLESGVNVLVMAKGIPFHPSIFSLSSQSPRSWCVGNYEAALGVLQERSSCVVFWSGWQLSVDKKHIPLQCQNIFYAHKLSTSEEQTWSLF